MDHLEQRNNEDSSRHSNITNSETESITRQKYLSNFSPGASQDLMEIDIFTEKVRKPKHGSLIESSETTNQPSSLSSFDSPTSSHPPGYDPNRIPANIFAGKPASPIEWSVASNESLFSIQMGNNSFSRDHIFVLYKSGELPKLDDQVKQNNYKNDEAIMGGKFDEPVRGSRPSLPTVNEGDVIDQNFSEEEKENEPKVREDRSIETDEQNHKERKVSKPLTQETRATTRSDESMNSVKSFAFPVLEGGEERNTSIKMDVKETNTAKQPPLAQPPEKQPSKHALEEKVESAKPSSEEVEPKKEEEQQVTPQTPNQPTPMAGWCVGWFSCFSCCSSCC